MEENEVGVVLRPNEIGVEDLLIANDAMVSTGKSASSATIPIFSRWVSEFSRRARSFSQSVNRAAAICDER